MGDRISTFFVEGCESIKKPIVFISIALVGVMLLMVGYSNLYLEPAESSSVEQQQEVEQEIEQELKTNLVLVFLEEQNYTVTIEPDNFMYYSYFMEYDPDTITTWRFSKKPSEISDKDKPSNFPYIETKHLDIDFQQEMLIVSYGRKMVSLCIDEEDILAIATSGNEGLNMLYPRLMGVMGKEFYPNTAFVYKTRYVDSYEALPEDIYDRWRQIEA